jgi:pullulanase
MNKLVYPIIVCSLALLHACNPNDSAEKSQHSEQAQHNENTVVNNSAAHWLTPTIFAIASSSTNINKAQLVSVDHQGEQQILPLTSTLLPASLKTKYPHLAKFQAYQIDTSLNVKTLIKGQNNVEMFENGNLVQRSFVQQYGVIDALFTSSNNDANEQTQFGATIDEQGISFKLWAPTATSVSVQLYDDDKQKLAEPIALVEDSNTGIWHLSSLDTNPLQYYRYNIDVYHPESQKFEHLSTTDPYSLSLSTNSKHSQIIDLNAANTKPIGWDNQQVISLDAPEDSIIYETHIRDFSANDKALSNPSFSGKYKAFSEHDSFGIKHLKKLQKAGLNTIHLLPTFDLSTIDEVPGVAISLNDPMTKVCQQLPDLGQCSDPKTSQLSLYELLASFDTNSADAQQVIDQIRSKDDYNWGYDPYHYAVPEGSYALHPEGSSRIVEFREMVESLHNLGFRVVMDVVYNHTYAHGLAEKSVLDKVVPGYYHRYDPISGTIATSTCCANTATEHAMMEKLMSDSLVTWAQHYKIDGFRFDLMGHQPKDAMLRARVAVQQVDPDTYFYGEGWNFGEVANNAQFVQATQHELRNTEIGTFSDRLRDAVRGGNFNSNQDTLRRDQGIANGLFVIPNDLQPEDKQRQQYVDSMDVVRLGLAANLTDFSFSDITGNTITGSDVPYGGGAAGYTGDPADSINYVSKHDNQTLWDNNQYRIAYDTSSDDRVRMQILALAYPLLSQGIPFLHMGSELLRSKSFLRDSYDYGDWFNAVDFSYQTNNYNKGLPPADKDQENWPLIHQLLKQNQGRDFVSPEQIEQAGNRFAELIKLRASSVLFRLRTAEQIKQKVSFLNSGPQHQDGLIVMLIDDNKGQKVDPNYQAIVVVFNNTKQSQTFAYAQARQFSLHPILQHSVDKIGQQATANNQGFVVPGLTASVFIAN